ncbi:sensor histidine kinase [Microbacterium yannicii]|uniref:sensor histidine kinase n=1 Tax=Microbacterium yannicii TaxID=671622 RepID=UPI00030640DB|nr:histidine kinase [Microbacterium yannicii]
MFRRLKPFQLVVDVSIAVVFFLIATPIELVITGQATVEAFIGRPATLFAAVLIAALFSGALAVRRVSPALALGLAWAGALLQVGLGRSPSFADLAVFAVLYATAAYGSTRLYWAGFASAILGALVITVYLTTGPLMFSGGGLSWETLPSALLLLVAAAFALGLSWTVGALLRSSVRARANREAQERAEGEAAAEQERVRIARDMHDIVAHSLAVVIAQADGARYALAAARPAGSPDAVADQPHGANSPTSSGAGAAAPGPPSVTPESALASEALGTISATARAALADVRLLLTQLRHRQGDGPQPTLADLETLYAHVRAAGVQLRVDVDPAPPGTPPASAQLAVYRILQEALTNALRHGAPGGPVDVRLAWLPDRVEVEVRNPLAGTPPSVEAHRGHGLIGMRERAQLVGGRLDAGADPAGSFLVSAVLPVGEAP